MLPHQFKDNAPCQLGSSYGMRTMPLVPRQHNSSKRKGGNEKQEGQGAPNGGNRLQVSDIFISLKRQEETSDIFFLLHTNIKRGFS